MPPTLRRRLTAGCLAGCAAALLAACGTQTPTPRPSSNPLPAGAANTTDAPAYGPDVHAAQALSGVLSQSAERDLGGATGP